MTHLCCEISAAVIKDLEEKGREGQGGLKRKQELCICISIETVLGRLALDPLWSERHKVRCLAAGQRLLQQQFAGNGMAQENTLQRPPNLLTGTRNSWVSLSICPVSLVTSLSQTCLQIASSSFLKDNAKRKRCRHQKKRQNMCQSTLVGREG